MNAEITKQGDCVRNLKTQKASKSDIDSAVKVLLSLKSDYKNLTGQDWKPIAVTNPPVAANDDTELLNKIAQQGDKVRDLKMKKAEKSVIDGEVKVLLQLKADYKSLTGQDWKPGAVPINKPAGSQSSTIDETEILNKIAQQGDKVRDLKTKKAEKSVIDGEVKLLLQLKADYKTLTGQDWKPGAVPISKPASLQSTTINEAEILKKITAQGDKVRDLKTKKAEKSVIDGEVKVLLQLKADYKSLTGQDWKPDAAPRKVADVTASGDDPKKVELTEKVNTQGNVVRELKSKKAPKVDSNRFLFLISFLLFFLFLGRNRCSC